MAAAGMQHGRTPSHNKTKHGARHHSRPAKRSVPFSMVRGISNGGDYKPAGRSPLRKEPIMMPRHLELLKPMAPTGAGPPSCYPDILQHRSRTSPSRPLIFHFIVD